MAGWDLVQAHLLTYLPNLAGLSAANVFDGDPVTTVSPASFAAVGTDGAGTGGYFEQEDIDPGALVTEHGEVNCRFVAQSGDTDLSSLRTTTKSWVDSLRAHLQADKTLGNVLTQGSIVTVGRADIRQIQNTDGSAVELIVAVRYLTRL